MTRVGDGFLLVAIFLTPIFLRIVLCTRPSCPARATKLIGKLELSKFAKRLQSLPEVSGM
jgi:hypothetical protein